MLCKWPHLRGRTPASAGQSTTVLLVFPSKLKNEHKQCNVNTHTHLLCRTTVRVSSSRIIELCVSEAPITAGRASDGSRKRKTYVSRYNIPYLWYCGFSLQYANMASTCALHSKRNRRWEKKIRSADTLSDTDLLIQCLGLFLKLHLCAIDSLALLTAGSSNTCTYTKQQLLINPPSSNLSTCLGGHFRQQAYCSHMSNIVGKCALWTEETRPCKQIGKFGG